MTKGLEKIFNGNLWISNNYDLRTHSNVAVIGEMPIEGVSEEVPREILHRPLFSYRPGNHCKVITGYPQAIKTLYNVAASDMRCNGKNPDEYNMYILFQSGCVHPFESLRADFWHFDLMRLLRASRVETDTMPVAVGYATSDALPTIYLTKLFGAKSLNAYETIKDEEGHNDLAINSLLEGFIFRPQAGEIVRYDSLTMHRGAPNDTGRPLHRTFLHVGFVPVP